MIEPNMTAPADRRGGCKLLRKLPRRRPPHRAVGHPRGRRWSSSIFEERNCRTAVFLGPADDVPPPVPPLAVCGGGTATSPRNLGCGAA